MLPFLSPPLFTLCLLRLILLLCGKASKKREDMPSVHEGITARLFLLLFYPQSLTSGSLHAALSVSVSFACLCARWPACTKTQQLCHLSPLPALLSFFTFEDVNISPICAAFPSSTSQSLVHLFFFSSSLFPTPTFIIPITLIGSLHVLWIIAFPRW